MMDEKMDIEKMLREAGVSPTSNRVLVARELVRAEHPLSLLDLEQTLDTLDKSSISRVLALLRRHSVVHAVEDGRGVTMYELCHAHDHQHSPDDMHAHFYCNKCRRTYCFDEIAVPQVEVPEGFEVESVNYMLKGVCPRCKALAISN